MTDQYTRFYNMIILITNYIDNELRSGPVEILPNVLLGQNGDRFYLKSTIDDEMSEEFCCIPHALMFLTEERNCHE